MSDCDLYHGQWVYDQNGPLYSNNSCPVVTQMQNCQGNSRPYKEYENWRWKPERCNLPRFDPKKFVELMRGKTLAFIGDSVAQNQMESMLCILWQASIPTSRCTYNHDLSLIDGWLKIDCMVKKDTVVSVKKKKKKGIVADMNKKCVQDRERLKKFTEINLLTLYRSRAEAEQKLWSFSSKDEQALQRVTETAEKAKMELSSLTQANVREPHRQFV
ncbi:hypothetical protein POM88_033242 [Heracleum sosnowskyi]|uniref:Trichome birefringence-like N-terminal domain-containing protein n=1 Tax=Heracleum sosnowskyi TaxID=360622 RepID=A0AAD8I0U9_9APIA|nr:hypothetical protein POM88_033242 [Heracleum sosnowskyi]